MNRHLSHVMAKKYFEETMAVGGSTKRRITLLKGTMGLSLVYYCGKLHGMCTIATDFFPIKERG
jgi:hypothetical protein